MGTPLFSILIAHFNSGSYFLDCLNSILKQSYTNFEVIILDDCSTDGSLETVKTLVSSDHRFKIFQNDSNQGVGFTKNKLVSLCSGEICGFVDPDDAIHEDAVKIMVDAHQHYPNASIINSNMYICDEQLQVQRTQEAKKMDAGNAHFFNLELAIFHFATFKKASFLQTDGIHPYLKIAEDQDLYLKLYDVGEHEIIPETLYYYRKNLQGLIQTSKEVKILAWHWYVILRTAERRNLDVSDIIVENFILRDRLNKVKNSKWAKLGYKLGIFKNYAKLLD